ncbi:TolB-like translocation protein [Sunxiuqinia dokdonensis]|uniref:Peptidase MA-like domain-containing protein n=1 Tax=Sunxiuqinia dokdonensis TaxID=1409788 RepID=A0A0L8VCW4_9BACT|nr:hypothetical protein [Sunxiuqinia dokdonensis]KOH46304.1 hypothetical protein NC99_08410 [Sunxiuqinia dokdonensis]
MKLSCLIRNSCIFIFALALIAPLTGRSQYFSTGQEPAKIKWRQINTANFQLIYPEDYEEKARQVASIFEKVYAYGHQSLGHEPRKISVILHTHTVKSNGLVAWSPKRVELFTTPHQGIYAQDWIEQLAIHEFRHVVQMDKIQQELPRLLTVLFGEQAAAVTVGAYLPFWFIEGDAVVTETALSNAGRGRLPSFLMENKAQAVEKGLYSFNKASMGSYKDFVPNRYKFGYWMVGGTRQKYGAHFWSDVLEEIAQRPLSVSPFNRVLKRETGFRQKELYETLFSEYRKEWSRELEGLDLTPVSLLTQRAKFQTNYTQAHALNDSTIIALKHSRSDLTRIVKLTAGAEEIVFTPGSIFQESFSGEKNMLIWSERRPDVRWTHADRSVIVVYNIANRKKQEFRYENKLFSPQIAPEKLRFAAVEVDKTNRYFLSVFDLASGKRLKQFAFPQNPFLFTPCWDSNGEKLYFVALSSQGKSLVSVNLFDEKLDTLIAASFHEIRNPEFADGTVYFTGSFTGIDNIYAHHLNDGNTEQLSSVAFGADYPAISNGKILLSNYTSDGYQLASLDNSEADGTSLDEILPKKYELAETLARQEGQVLDFSDQEPAVVSSKPYRKLAHIFNFHSWAPVYVDIDDSDIQPGVSLFSQNKLGTAETRLGYEYNWEEEAGKYIVAFKYSGLFPVFDAELNYGKRNRDFKVIQQTSVQTPSGFATVNDTVRQNIEWNELSFEGGVSIPLVFSQGKYTQLVRPEIEYSYQNVSHTSSTPSEFYKGYYHALTYRLFLQNSLGRSELDLQARWAQAIEFIYRDGLKGSSDIGSLAAVQGYLFFPGFFNNHGIKIFNGYQNKKPGSSFAFGNSVRIPRGYHSFQNDKLYTLGTDYVMPLVYPDLSVGRLIYLKRVRSSFFYDYGRGRGDIYSSDGEVAGRYTTKMQSLGVELTADGHFLRLVTPVSLGFRGAYMPDTQNFHLQVLFSVSFDSL